MTDLPSSGASVTSTGDYTEAEYELSAADVGEFLIELGELLQAGDDVTLTGDGWDLQFAYNDTVELEIEHASSAAGADESPPSLG